ncbi:hypothetical protein A3I42_02570 [Candidatus Uhrbacteria bacterium RIFCSPLOWO2_02_FULL_49_11]|uniref:Glycoside-hydrolase family GH114 TIM-barrel domain-containing protein n=1 Tax=Candidatus Uhrbacteria bacterium RIFCSPLOWO2_02_FULL_49_11 TaxID=1802409 RepID=A0A1F7VB65_9BACT|nr:MAG: hypothetical protein A3I42_02570 [Candidatus Uhrbacteria bacterium RIFCSPLOWO2_02_FULL_49_11]
MGTTKFFQFRLAVLVVALTILSTLNSGCSKKNPVSSQAEPPKIARADSSLSRPLLAYNHDPFYLDGSKAKEIRKRYRVVTMNIDVPRNSPTAWEELQGMIRLADIQVGAVDILNSGSSSTDNINHQLVYNVDPGYRLYQPNGRGLSFQSQQFPYMNPANNAPLVNGERWNTLHPQHINEIVNRWGYDGVWADNTWNNFPNAGLIQVDYDRDGSADPWNPGWLEGTQTLLRNTRGELGVKFIVFNGPGNPSEFAEANGRTMERFPGNFGEFSGIVPALEHLQSWIWRGNKPQLSIMGFAGSSEADALFGVCCALLLGENCYLFYHPENNTPEWYQRVFGAPIGVPFEQGASWLTRGDVLYRTYTGGIVAVNTGGVITSFDAGQDFLTLDGNVTRTVEIHPMAGAMLLKIAS